MLTIQEFKEMLEVQCAMGDGNMPLVIAMKDSNQQLKYHDVWQTTIRESDEKCDRCYLLIPNPIPKSKVQLNVQLGQVILDDSEEDEADGYTPFVDDPDALALLYGDIDEKNTTK